MRHILSNSAYNEVNLKLLMWIKRTASLYCRGRPPGKYKIKKDNIISNFRTAVTYIRVTAASYAPNLSQDDKACKQIDFLFAYRLFLFSFV